MTSKGRTRSANFTLTEKELLKELVREFSQTLNKKKVDKLAWKEKQQVWDEICSTFNDISTVGVYRSKESLKKLYDNHLRKDISESESDNEDIDDLERNESENRRNLKMQRKSTESEGDSTNTATQYSANNLPSKLHDIADADTATDDKMSPLKRARLDLRQLKAEFENEIAMHDMEVDRLKNEAKFQRDTLKLLECGNKMLNDMLRHSKVCKMRKLKELEELIMLKEKINKK